MRSDYVLRKKMDIVLAALTPANRLVAEVALHTGLRVADVLALRTEQLRSGGRFWITEAKTHKRRMIGLPAPLRAALLAQAGEVWVFPGRKGDKPRTRQAVWKDVKRAARAFRMPENITPHTCRKVYAVELMRRYGDLDRVQRALNHDRYTTTLLYAMADKLVKSDRQKTGKGRKNQRAGS